MSDEVTTAVKTVSDGTVTIAVEKYHELLSKAAEKAPVIYRTVQKTPEMAASDNKVIGGIFLASGVASLAIGSIVYVIGRNQAKSL